MASELKPQSSRDLWAIPGFGRMIDELLPTHWPTRTDRALQPAMDVEEDENQITIRTELPGMGKEDVKITLEDGVLSLSGEKKSDREPKNKSFHLVERSFGVFHRSITLPTGVDAAQAKASFKDGLLVIEIPRSEAAKPRTLDIS